MTPMIGDRADRRGHDGLPARDAADIGQYGVYIRDQFELNRKMTVSAGVRWEYYPLSQRARPRPRGVRFPARQLLICGVSGNSANVRHHRRKESLHAAAGLGISPHRVDGHPRRLFAQPAERHVGPQPDAAVPGVSGDHHPGRSRRRTRTPPSVACNDGVTIVPQFDLTVGRVRPTPGITTYRGKFVRGTISSWNVSMQQLLPFSHSLTLGYVANRQRGMTRNLNENYGQLGGGTASQPYSSSSRPRRSTCRARTAEWTTTRSRRASTSGCRSGLQYTVAYTFAKAIDWWAGNDPAAGVLVSEQGRPGQQQSAPAEHVGDLRAAVRRGTEVPERRRRGVAHRRRMAGQRVLHRAIGHAVHRHAPARVAQRRHRHQPDGRSGQGRRGDLRVRARRRVLRRHRRSGRSPRSGSEPRGTTRCAGPAWRIST